MKLLIMILSLQVFSINANALENDPRMAYSEHPDLCSVIPRKGGFTVFLRGLLTDSPRRTLKKFENREAAEAFALNQQQQGICLAAFPNRESTTITTTHTKLTDKVCTAIEKHDSSFLGLKFSGSYYKIMIQDTKSPYYWEITEAQDQWEIWGITGQLQKLGYCVRDPELPSIISIAVSAGIRFDLSFEIPRIPLPTISIEKEPVELPVPEVSIEKKPVNIYYPKFSF